MRTLVSLDIETTGFDPERDAILEIGIVRFRGEDVLEEWSSLIDPQRPIPHKITELTGITDDLVRREGITLWDGLREAQRIIGNAPIIGHNIAFDLGFFKSLKTPPSFTKNTALDTFELAGILVPHAGRYSLSALAAELGISLPESHRAMADARTAHQLYLKVFERAVALPREIVDEIGQHADRSGWTLADFWRDVKEEQARGAFSTSIGAQLRRLTHDGRRQKDPSAVLRRRSALQAKPLQPKEQTQPLDVERVAATLASDGPFAAKFPGYEMRPQQVEMLRKVTQTFNEGGVAFIEAGTGVGKSLAYLIPAMRWAMQNDERVVVSTNTINLQEQLADKDVPAVVGILGEAGRAAVMKGKGRYLCPNRFADLRRNGPKTADEARLLAKILIWLPNTLTGDADELFIPTPGERAAFQHLSAQNPICNANTCSATDCFFHQARRLAESAHVVIVNHALLLADIAVENHALPEYKYLIVDEAHHLEAAATDSLTYRLDRDEIQRALSDLGRATKARQAGSSGLLAEIAAAGRNLLATNHGAALDGLCDQAMEGVSAASSSNNTFFDELGEFLADEAGGDSSDYTQRVRLTRALRNRSGWTRVEIAFDNLQRDLNVLARQLNNIFKALSEASELIADFDALVTRLHGAIRFITEASEQLNGMIAKPSDERIYWVDIETARKGARQPRLTLNAAPLHVGPLMQRDLWQKKHAVVLTSATMRTSAANGKSEPSFDYIKSRLSAPDADTLALGSPFDYASSTLLYLVTDIPEPNQQGYQQAVERGLIELFRASEGRGLALFTSYSALRATARAITPALLRDDILVFEQGDGTSRRAMIEGFRAADRAVMLGTKSFWEGVDIQGEKLSALAICKLPFDVPTDPIFAARSETFENPFNEYSVPETVLRFRQGFGRLIRSKRDRGVIVVFDRRLLTKSYGAAFLNALPGPKTVRAPLAQLGKAVRDWLATHE
ncbi:MAG: helicase C-terminal domain-containing protein [Candidatus Brachytrichaceae bacterium NZ_4S206]|jgi:DNA polymerase-3 subunit epsilon/ATP-dependent DNA helicase DinG